MMVWWCCVLGSLLGHLLRIFKHIFAQIPEIAKRPAVPNVANSHGHDRSGDAGWLAHFGRRHPTRVGLPREGLRHQWVNTNSTQNHTWGFFRRVRAMAPGRRHLHLRVRRQHGEDLGRSHGQLPTDLDRSHRYCDVSGLRPRRTTPRLRELGQSIKIWEATTGKCLQTLTGHTDAVKSVAYSPDGQHLVSASWDSSIKIWEAATGKCLQTLTAHTNNVMSVPYSPDGQHLVSGSWDNSMQIWEAATGNYLLPAALDRSHQLCDFSGLQPRRATHRVRELGQFHQNLGGSHGQLPTDLDSSHRSCDFSGLQPRRATHRLRERWQFHQNLGGSHGQLPTDLDRSHRSCDFSGLQPRRATHRLRERWQFHQSVGRPRAGEHRGVECNQGISGMAMNRLQLWDLEHMRWPCCWQCKIYLCWVGCCVFCWCWKHASVMCVYIKRGSAPGITRAKLAKGQLISAHTQVPRWARIWMKTSLQCFFANTNQMVVSWFFSFLQTYFHPCLGCSEAFRNHERYVPPKTATSPLNTDWEDPFVLVW